jgi:DNA-binding NarL/FixJ family response regulator
VFKNTYTVNGRLVEVKGWHVKIQYQGVRRTFSLSATTRAHAALEAQAIYQTLLAQGWDAALMTANPRRRRSPVAGEGTTQDHWPKTDARHWRARLLLRKYFVPADASHDREFSVRIEHAGASAYFPLDTLDQDAAAAKALEIYLRIVKEGWEAANQNFSRELTVAILWVNNPVAWTYATFRTQLRGASHRIPAASLRPKACWKAAVIESDPGIRRALAACLNRHAEFFCDSAFSNLEEGLREISRRAPHLLLVNRNLANVTSADSLKDLHAWTPDLPTLVFSIYEDSEQLFKATPGGACGYLLKRTPPDRILEPIAGAFDQATLSAELIAARVRRYFQNLLKSLPALDTTANLSKLTHREQEVLSLLSKGYVDKEIADVLRISAWTVHGHVKHIFEKLGVHSRTEAVVKFFQK